jgi:membrane associated rhomboid family serine protease
MAQPTAWCNLAVIALTAYCSYQGFTRPAFVERYIFCPEYILRDKQYYRLVSSSLLHADWMHLLFNMYSLYSFGGAIEHIFGYATFLIIYFAGVVGGDLVSLYLHRNHDYRALGASGGVCGIIFACIFLLPGTGVRIFLIPVTIPAYIYAIMFMAWSYFGIRRQRGNIGHDAHLGGAIIGLLAATALHPKIVPENPVLYTIVMSLAIVLFVCIYKFPLHRPCARTFSAAHFREKIARARSHHQQISRQKDEETIDRLLEKVSRSGLDSLTRQERKKLREISKRKNQ